MMISLKKYLSPRDYFNPNANIGKRTYFIAEYSVVIFSATFISAALRVALKWKVGLMNEPETC